MGRRTLRLYGGPEWRRLRRAVLAEEDRCWICGQPVDKRAPSGTPLSPQVDHVVPLVEGGPPLARSNLRLAHMHCNGARGRGRRTVTRAW